MSALTALWILGHERPAIELFYLTLLETFAGDWINNFVMMNFKLTTSYSGLMHATCPIPLTTTYFKVQVQEEEEGAQKKKKERKRRRRRRNAKEENERLSPSSYRLEFGILQVRCPPVV